jgi:hypothetical protein
VDDETTAFRQNSAFQLVKDHHIPTGPSFPRPTDVTIDVPAGQVTWLEGSDKNEETTSQHMDLPPDFVNGMISSTVDNFSTEARRIEVVICGSGLESESS